MKQTATLLMQDQDVLQLFFIDELYRDGFDLKLHILVLVHVYWNYSWWCYMIFNAFQLSMRTDYNNLKYTYMMVSINGGAPKWLVYKEHAI